MIRHSTSTRTSTAQERQYSTVRARVQQHGQSINQSARRKVEKRQEGPIWSIGQGTCTSTLLYGGGVNESFCRRIQHDNRHKHNTAEQASELPLRRIETRCARNVLLTSTSTVLEQRYGKCKYGSKKVKRGEHRTDGLTKNKRRQDSMHRTALEYGTLPCRIWHKQKPPPSPSPGYCK